MMTRAELQKSIDQMLPGDRKRGAQCCLDADDFSGAAWWAKLIAIAEEKPPSDPLTEAVGRLESIGISSDGAAEMTVRDNNAKRIFKTTPGAARGLQLGDRIAINSEGLAVKAEGGAAPQYGPSLLDWNVPAHEMSEERKKYWERIGARAHKAVAKGIDPTKEPADAWAGIIERAHKMHEEAVAFDLAKEPDKTTHQIVEVDDANRILTAREVCAYAMPQPILIDGNPVEIKLPQYDAPYQVHEETAKREMTTMIQRVYREFPICEQSGLPVAVKIIGECREWLYKDGEHASGIRWEFKATFVCDHCRA